VSPVVTSMTLFCPKRTKIKISWKIRRVVARRIFHDIENQPDRH